MKSETLARSIVILVFVTLLTWLGLAASDRMDILNITASMPERGGWQPGDFTARVGEPLLVHLTSHDVVHGFAIGQMEGFEAEVLPGKVTEVELVFSEPGTYTYYCTRWCGPNHWRMRGTITVIGEGKPEAEVVTQPLYLRLGIDIDAEHPAETIPPGKPSAQEGIGLWGMVPSTYAAEMLLRSSSPAELFIRMRSDSGLERVSDQAIWDLVALAYWNLTSEAALEEGQRLFSENCAACHGVSGQGDGVFSGQLGEDTHQAAIPDFTDPARMLGASPALLQGKIVRGGMGTGMPYWGTIFTDEQTWMLVDYLWSMQFDYPIDEGSKE
jgi:mono/diheme cytochrome c family protein/plastocyanin